MKSLKLLFIIIRIKIADMEIKDTYNTLKEKYLDVFYYILIVNDNFYLIIFIFNWSDLFINVLLIFYLKKNFEDYKNIVNIRI